MISVAEALDNIFALVAPLGVESVPLRKANGRILASPIVARRNQPPFATSMMDGYAVREADAVAGKRLQVVGESAAGRRAVGAVQAGEAVRIFTGAPVPEGAERIVIQEDVTREGEVITLGDALDPGRFIRSEGSDFRTGDTIDAPRRLTPSVLSLAAAMNVPSVPCRKRPDVAIIATGNELVQPGTDPGPDQIIASNGLGLAAMLEEAGARTRLLPIAADTVEAISTAFDMAAGSDLILTIGGASVGDHDLVRPVASERGLAPSFYKVAMRPGKPLMAGKLDDVPIIGLPGNPVSALVCGQVFVVPAIRVMLGFPAAPAQRHKAQLSRDIGPNGPREHYMRAKLGPDGIAPFDTQDSGLLTILADANALLVRQPGDGPRATGATVEYIPLPARD